MYHEIVYEFQSIQHNQNNCLNNNENLSTPENVTIHNCPFEISWWLTLRYIVLWEYVEDASWFKVKEREAEVVQSHGCVVEILWEIVTDYGGCLEVEHSLVLFAPGDGYDEGDDHHEDDDVPGIKL